MKKPKNTVLYQGQEAAAIWQQLRIRNHRGWHGAFTTNRAPGALAAGVQIVKVNTDLGDMVQNGTRGRVLGSIINPEDGREILYFVEWVTQPRQAVACIGHKVQRATPLHAPGE